MYLCSFFFFSLSLSLSLLFFSLFSRFFVFGRNQRFLQSRPRGKIQKKLQKGNFAPTSSPPTPSETLPSDAPFSRLRPNDPSSGLTNDTREDPVADRNRTLTKTNPRTYFDVMLPLRITKKNHNLGGGDVIVKM